MLQKSNDRTFKDMAKEYVISISSIQFSSVQFSSEMGLSISREWNH
jgi:hypothetical protein